MRVLIVDDHLIVASGCRALFADDASVQILEASDADSGERNAVGLKLPHAIYVMIAGIEAENAASIRLHKKLGFRTTGTFQEVGTKFGRWLDLTCMELRIEPASGK